MFDLVLRGGTVIDPSHDVEGVRDVAITDGRIADVAPSIAERGARELDVTGLHVIPGIIDSHAHVGGTGEHHRGVGYRMAAQTGVTTVLDMGSTMDAIVTGIHERGAGLNVAALYLHSAAFDRDHPDPSSAQLTSALEQAMAAGAFGLKISGGHVPLTLDATARAVEVANRMRAYVAYHVGTTTGGSRLTGVRELPQIIGRDGRLHVAHVNSYCRGMDAPPLEECAEALSILREAGGRLVAESYLSLFNGTGGLCEGDEVVDHVTRNCLEMRGYTPIRTDLRRAILDGYCSVSVERGGAVELVSGHAGVEAWEAARTRVTVSFPVCPPETAFYLAVARESTGDFSVDALATDGGSIPRNFLVDRGLALVHLDALTLADYVRKVATNPARMLGFTSKGQLGVGADADLTVLDVAHRRALHSFALGRPVLADGVVVGSGGTVLVTEAGESAVARHGLPTQLVDPARASMYG